MNNIIELFCYEKLDNKIALSDDNVSFSYVDLFKTILCFASYLHNKGIENERILVPCFRSASAVIIFLSIACSNNTFIPVDENSSNDFTSKIARLSNAKYFVNLGNKNYDCLEPINYLEATECKTIFDVDFFKQGWSKDNEFCIIFTSGSTGEPKGVVKTHHNFLSFADNFANTFKSFPIFPNIANQSPLFFDASMKDIVITLKTKGTLYFPNRTLFAMTNNLIDYLNQYEINVLFWVPSALSIVAKTKILDFVKPLFLSHVFFVGEVFPTKYLNYWIEKLPNVNFYNIYGSTELAGVCLYYKVDGIIEPNKVIPLGKPIVNNTVTLNEGEIVVNSNQIANGYINSNNLNEKVFIKKNGVSELHTGDYAFIDEDGNYVFVSRKDYQIKHMGYRIELQAIDNYIVSFDLVESCCTMYDKEKDKIISAVVMRNKIDNPIAYIINKAKAAMPFYMVPNKIVIMNEMPLNQNGKIDRQRLKETII